MNPTLKSKITLFLMLMLGIQSMSYSRSTPEKDSVTLEKEKMMAVLDSLNRFERAIPYQEGVVDVKDFLTLNIPKGYKFIPEQQAQSIVTGFWNNPADNTIIGMLVPADYSLTDFNSWAFVLSYEEVGYVADKDAEDIDYDEMLKGIQDGEAAVNEQRVAQGYPSVHVLGWATKPRYDNDRKILHWAKKVKFGEEATVDSELTLNYDVRVLGRKGVLSMNAIGTMAQFPLISQRINDVLAIATFKNGHAYKDFNPDMDKVAAYTVGGLIAGKLLAKTGILLLLLKNIKLVLLAVAGLIGAFRKRIARLFGRKNNDADSNHPEDDSPLKTVEVPDEMNAVSTVDEADATINHYHNRPPANQS